MTEFAVGDVVRFHRGEFSHVALYVGRSSVIHLWTPTNARAFCVRIDSMRHVRGCQRVRDRAADEDDAGADDADDAPQLFTREMDARMLRDHCAEPFEGDEVVRRARSRLGETRYDYLAYNCEHFVTWARYGVGASPQATSHTNQVLAGALLGAAIGGLAGLVVGGAISLFSKMNALSASSSGVLVDEASEGGHDDDDGENEDDHVHVEAVDEDVHERRREERERLLEGIANIQLEEEDGSLVGFEAWVASRQQHRSRATPRAYSEERHNALAVRLADDKLQCGICFYDLQLTRAVVFPCDHFTCTKCHDALVTNNSGFKCCPYCRTHITQVETIHRSTKRAARTRLVWEQEVAAAAAATPSSV